MNSDVSDLYIELLADHPDVIPTLASWEQREWGYLMPDVSLEQFASACRRRANRDRIPMTLIGFVGDELVATSSLIVHDMATRKDLSPWLAIVYVDPDHRRKGYGAAMVRAAMNKASELGVGELYLFTPDQMAFYEKLGWSMGQVLDYRGESVTIMKWIP